MNLIDPPALSNLPAWRDYLRQLEDMESDKVVDDEIANAKRHIARLEARQEQDAA